MKNSTLAFALGVLVLSGSICAAQEGAERVAVPGPKKPNCKSTVDVAGMHYPNQSCAQSKASFLAGMLTSYHFTSKCVAPSKLTAVFNVSCQDAPIPGFSTGSVYKGTACCNSPEVVIPDLPMQGGTEKTPCPVLGVVYTRAQANPSVPYLQNMLPGLDQQCAGKGPGLKMVSIKFKTCCADPRGVGFGPNATADLTCG